MVIAAPSLSLRRALDRADDRHMRATAAFEAGEPVANLLIARVRCRFEQRGGRHDPAIDAVAALRHLLLDIGGLDRMRLLGRAEAGERNHFAVTDRRERRHARADRLAIEVHGAGAALREPAAEVGVAHLEIVAQSVQQRHVRIGVDRYRAMIDDGLLDHAADLVNDFEEVIFARLPHLAALKSKLYECGAAWAAMTGSGSTIAGAFRQVAQRDQAATRCAGVRTVSCFTMASGLSSAALDHSTAD